MSRYGKPISMEEFTSGITLNHDDSTRTVVKEITSALQKRLRAMTINALDWYAGVLWHRGLLIALVCRDTFNAAKAVRDMAWNGGAVALDRYVDVSQE